MEELHKDLCKRHAWYDGYHRLPGVTLLNFAAFILVGTLVATSLQNVVFADTLSTPVASAAGNQPNQNIAQLTGQILRAAKQYQAAPPQAQAQAESTLRALLASRAELMAAEASNNPYNFLLNAMPAGITKQLPDFAQALLEQDADIEGALTVIHVDAPPTSGKEFTIYDLATGSGASRKTYHLHFTGNEGSGLATGARVRVHGVALQNELVAAAGGGNTTTTAPATIVTATGPQSTIIILVNFTDNTSQPWTPAQVASTLFTASNSTNLFYQENSFGKVSIAGDVTGWYTVPVSYTLCDSSYYTVASSADAAATAAGVNLANYAHKVYVYNTSASCSWGGMGTLGGAPSQAWIYGNGTNPTVYAHELGHNLLVHHAQWLNCGSVAIAPYLNCSISEYGDPSDVMGYNWSHYNHFVSGRKLGENWLSSANMQTITTSGTYTITPEETNDSSIKMLKIAKPDTAEAYYVDFRQPSGFDATLPAAFVNGAAIRIWNGNISTPTKLVDTTPDGNAANAPLADGQSFSDIANGIVITQLSHTPTSTTVNVQLSGPPCVVAAPTLTISPLSQGGASGVAKTYTLSLKNNDNSTCSSSAFAWSGTVPAGWSASFSASATVVVPGSTGSASMTVTPPAGTIDGSYSVVAQATDGSVVSHTASATATYVSLTPDTTAPATSITSPVDGTTISGLVSISANASDNVGVSKVELWRDGVLVASSGISPYTFAWDTAFSANGVHTLQTKAYDGAGNVGTSAVVTVNVSNTNPDITPPTVTITSPANGYNLRGNSLTTINVSASDAGGISNIKIAADGVTLKTCTGVTTCSVSYGGKTVAAGTHNITATAVDNANNSGSPSITITK